MPSNTGHNPHHRPPSERDSQALRDIRGRHHPPAAGPSVIIEAELAAPGLAAQIMRFDLPTPTDRIMPPSQDYRLNMCLTPRPLHTRGSYHRHWGPHRFERLGDIFLVPPGKELHIRSESGRQVSLTCQLGPEHIEELTGHDLEWTDQRLAATLDIGHARIRALLYRITEEVRHPEIAAVTLLQLLGSQLAIELGRHCLAVHQQAVTGGLAGWRLRLIDERITQDSTTPSLTELADICSISVRQLTRGFRVSRGCSLGDYIEQRRMETAKRLLMASETVKTVAFQLGFGSPASFAFAFRRAVGISPNLFRQRQLRTVMASV